MSSKNLREKGYMQPPAADEDEKSVFGDARAGQKRRQASVYDAVAGRVTTTLPLMQSDSQRPHARHHKPRAADSTRDPTLAPEEVLFKRAGAPVRYAEKDIYQAHEALPDGGRGILPDSDLLKTIHNYVSHFYSDLPANQRTAREAGDGDGTVAGEGEGGAGTAAAAAAAAAGSGEGISERSMDESALVAFGILLEEACREALGKRGDLVFTEGMEIDEEAGEQQRQEERPSSILPQNQGGPAAERAEISYGFNHALKYQEACQQRLKRRRLVFSPSTDA